MTTRWMWICPLMVVAACSSSERTSSGVPGEKKLSSLSASEQTDVCDYLAEILDGPRTVTCGQGSSVEISDFSGCNLADVKATCEATVADMERCFEAVTADPCSFNFTPCEAVFACAIDIVPDRGPGA